MTTTPDTMELRRKADASRDAPIRDRLSGTYDIRAHAQALAAWSDLRDVCTPDTILALLDRVEAAEGRVKVLERQNALWVPSTMTSSASSCLPTPTKEESQ